MLRRNTRRWTEPALFCAVLATLLVLAMTLAGCGSAPTTVGSSSTTTSLATVTALPTSTTADATATASTTPGGSGPTSTTFPCSTTTSGTQKTFSDSQLQLSFNYPAAWTENQCQRTISSDGSETLIIGNLFSVAMMPRGPQTIQQWVSMQTDQYEVVTLGPLTVPHAQAAVSVSAQPAATPNPNKPFDAEPFAQTIAIVSGSEHFYVMNWLIAQMSMSDTMPGLSRQQMLQQIVTTFAVP